MELTANDIARLVNGKLSGNGNAVIRGAAGLNEAGPNDVSFLRDVKKINLLKKTKAGLVFVPTGLSSNGKTLVHVENPVEAFSIVLGKLEDEKLPRRSGVHPLASIAKSARIGKNVFIGPFCVIEDDAVIGDDVVLRAQVYVGLRTTIGQGTTLHPHVVLREDIQVGARCIIHAGAVIGSDGYGFYFAKGKHNKIPQIGSVIIEDDVEIGSCTAIDRATTGTTRIGKGTKIDNLVQIAHNVKVGQDSVIVSQVGIAGSTTIGRNVVLAGQAGVAGHLNIGDGCVVAAQTGVMSDVPARTMLFGSPGRAHREAFKLQALFGRLPELFDRLKELEKKLSLGTSHSENK
jgi:UDP-3-O-[3-hydroxymyristoyl] glucosamine N-acyltransferase